MTSYDIIVIGGGHNGLAAATVLAKRGKKVLVLEAADAPGGMARGHEIAPGYLVSRAAHLAYRLDERVISELGLRAHGLEYASASVATVCLSPDAEPLTLKGAWGETVDGVEPSQAAAWAALRKRLLFQAGTFGKFDRLVPVQPGHASLKQKLALAASGLSLRMAGEKEFRQFLRMAGMCVADIAEEKLSDERLMGLIGFDATLGIRLGPRSPTSVIGLYHRLAGGGNLAVVKGGMAGLANAFAEAAKAAGVELRMSSPVANIEIEAGRAVGVRFADGEVLSAHKVLSATSPVSTFLDLVGARHLDTEFARELRHLRGGGNVAKLNIALSAPPRFGGAAEDNAARFVHAPSIRHVETSFNPQKYGELPDDPPFEAVVESAFDKSLAPAGGAVVSVAVANVPHDLNGGWEKGRARLEKAVLDRLDSLSPGFSKSVVACETLTPPDLAALFGSGHWHHVELQADRLYALRPVFGAAHYRTPVDGLYLCGAGTHPGGGISGLSGIMAAGQIIGDDGR
ncbi:MAG: NAD(P)/FAD-dependent oxidoreductase [Nitratireductor sp.]|nr:NAD(P)/FAD-dependent oxidoreductase [Nitratireductor sp.]